MYMVDNGILSVMMALAFLLGLLSVSGCATALFKRKFEEVIAPVIFSVILTVYLSGLLFDDLSVGVRIVEAVAAVSAAVLGFGLYQARRDSEKKEKIRRHIAECFVTPGFVCWSVMFAVIYIVYSGKILAGWDEFSHWGLVVKNMFIFDRFGNCPESTVSFRDYPPGTALWQYFTAKAFSSRLGENHIYHAMGWLIISLQASFLRFFSGGSDEDRLSFHADSRMGAVKRTAAALVRIFSEKKVREAFFSMLLIMFVPLLFTQYIFIYFNSV